jgi:MFS family permease
MDLASDLEAALSKSRVVVDKSREAARNYFAHRVISPDQLPGIMRKHIYTGAMGSAYFTLVTGIIFVYYGNTLGMSELQWALLSSVSAFLLTAQLFSALMTERFGRRKLLWFVTAIVGRIVRVAALFASLLLWKAGHHAAVLVLVAGVALSNFFDAMASPPWLSWLADLIPANNHGGFWGRRSAWVAFSAICIVIPVGIIMDDVPEAAKMPVAVAIFAVAGAIGVIDLFIHGTLPEPMLPPAEPAPAMERVMAPLRDPAFRPWLRFNTAWSFDVTLGGCLSMVFFLKHLGINNNLAGGMVVLTVMPLLTGVLTAPWSGRLVDRVGPRKVLTWGHFLWGFLPLFWIVATPATALYWLGWSSVQGNAGSNAALTAANKLITRLPRPQDRAMYTAISSCLASVAGGFGALAAGTFLHVLDGWSFTLWGKTFIAFHLLFLISATLRLSTVRTLLPAVTDPAAQTAPSHGAPVPERAAA